MRLRLNRFAFVFVSAFLLSGTALAAEDAFVLWARVVENVKRNGVQAHSYTFLEDSVDINYETKGKNKGAKKYEDSARYETIFVEGLPYRRQLLKNGKPLTGKAAEKEEKRYQKTLAERRSMSIAQKKASFLSRSFQQRFPLEDYPRLFTATVRQAEDNPHLLKVTMTPRPDARPRSDNDKEMLRTSAEFWIDKADELPVRQRIEYLADATHMLLKGSTLEFTWQKMPDGTYVLNRFFSKFRMKYMWMVFDGQNETLFHDYRKFQVDTRILPGVQEVSSATPEPSAQP